MKTIFRLRHYVNSGIFFVFFEIKYSILGETKWRSWESTRFLLAIELGDGSACRLIVIVTSELTGNAFSRITNCSCDNCWTLDPLIATIKSSDWRPPHLKVFPYSFIYREGPFRKGMKHIGFVFTMQQLTLSFSLNPWKSSRMARKSNFKDP